MKKTYITTEAERHALYVGIEAVYGGWIMETSGDPTCLNELEQAEAEAEITAIAEVIADPTTPWENLNEADLGYIQDTLESWGL